MKFQKFDKNFLLRLELGEPVVLTITNFCKNQQIYAGFVNGLGSMKNIELGYYELLEKEYKWQKFEETMEVASMTGNIAIVNNEPFLHIHTVLSGKNYQTVAGHLKEGVTGATLEILLTQFEREVERKMDDEIGLRLLDLKNE